MQNCVQFNYSGVNALVIKIKGQMYLAGPGDVSDCKCLLGRQRIYALVLVVLLGEIYTTYRL